MPWRHYQHLVSFGSNELQLMARGLTNKEIGFELGISPITARNHVSSVLRALDVSNRTEAVIVGTCQGLIDDGAQPRTS